MIRLSPQPDINVPCPTCGNPVLPQSWKATGMRFMLDCRCGNCDADFFAEAPINAGLFYPGIIDKRTGKRVDKLPFENWYLNGLILAHANQKDDAVAVEVIEHKKIGSRPVLLLNTIDATYGHALYELFNASYYLDKKEFDLVIIVQKNLAWLVPQGAAQVWIADISFSKANHWMNAFDSQVKKLLKDTRDVFVCRSFVQTDSTDFNIKDYTRVDPFPLESWDERLLHQPLRLSGELIAFGNRYYQG